MKETQLSGQTPDLARVNYEKLKALFPDIVSDGKIDGKKLKQLVGNTLTRPRSVTIFPGTAKARR